MPEAHGAARVRLVANTLANAVAQLFALAIAFVLAPLLIRAFGHRGYGDYVLVVSVSTFTLLLDFGLGPSIEKLLAGHVAAGRRVEAGALLASIGWLYAGIGMVVGAVDLALVWLAPRIFHLTPGDVTLVRRLLLVAATAALAWWPASIGIRILGGLQRYTRVATVTAAIAAANAVSAVFVALTGRGPLALAIANNVVNVGAQLVMCLLARRELRARDVHAARPSRAALREALAFSGPVFALQLAVQILYYNTDRVLLGIFLGSLAVTLYEGPSRFVALLIQLTSIGNSALLPFASQLEATRRTETIAALLLRASRYVSAFVAPIALLIAVLAKPLLVTWLGPSFAAVELPTVLLAGLQVLLVSLTVGHTIVVGIGKLPGRLPVILTIVTVNLVLSVVLVRTIGIVGVALGTVVAAVLDYPLHLWYLARHAGLRMPAFLQEVVLPVYPLLLLPAAIGVGARLTGVTATLPGTLATLVTGALAYWLAFAAIAMSREERNGLLLTARSVFAPRGTVAP